MGKKLSQVDFIEKCSDAHNDKYDYIKTVYINYRTKITITCPIHGDFEMLPDNHINQKQGCVKCVQDNHKLSKITNDRLENIKKTHNNKYLYKNLQVIDGQIEIICPTHGKFKQSIYNHERGHGCNQCNIDSRKVIRYRVCKCCGNKKERSDYDSKYKTCKNCIENKPIPTSKFCNKCGVEKIIDDFYTRNESSAGYRNECIECLNESKKPTRKIYRQANKISLRKYDIQYRKDRMVSDPFYRAKMDARNIIRKSLRERGYSKKSRTFEILGCSYIEFKNHIESLFKPEMNWENRNEWHIDHIIPLSFAQNEKELLLLNNYKNLRPLWEKENLEKSDNIIIETELYSEILNSRISIQSL